MPSSPLPLRLAGLALALSAAVLPACAAPVAADDDPQVTEAELGADDDAQSWDAYDATEAELAAAPSASPSTASADELTLYAIPAPELTGLSWKRPGGLARRTLLSKALGLHRALGHAAVRVQCAATATEPARHFEGSVIDTGDEFRTMVLKDKIGLGVLFRTVAGAIEPEADLQATIDQRYGNGRISFIRFAIAPGVCHALLGYADAFAEKDIGKAYGFVRPLYQEGAGCSAFSMAFLELANLDEARFRSEWSFDVRVPMSLIGGADNPGNSVSVLKLLFTTRPWASEDEPHERLVGWDPTKMFTSIRSMAKAGLRDRSVRVEKRGRALGLVLDRRGVTPRAELATRSYWAGTPGAARNYWGFGDP
jgi:hypothetical protein